MSVKVVSDVTVLREYQRDWEELAADAIEPNPFYEPWMLLPALDAFGANSNLEFALVFSDDPRPTMRGLFPLERKHRYKGLPISTLKLYGHLYCFSCIPLLHKDRARETLTAFFDWLESGAASCSLIEFNHISGQGPFYDLLTEEISRRRRPTWTAENYERGLVRRAAGADQYLRSTVSPVRLKKLRQQQRRLSEAGTLAYSSLVPGANVDQWIEDFLRLEASGWKGREKSAMICQEADRLFFEQVARSAFERNRLSMLAVFIDDRPIASQCNFLAGSGEFAFKTAFDERYARFSPGVLLEIENIKRLHSDSAIEWLDSCCGRDGTYFDAFCNDRKTMLKLAVGTGNKAGELAVSLLPLLRRIKRRLTNRTGQSAGKTSTL